MELKFPIAGIDMGSRKALDMRAGDSVRVHQKIMERGKFRLQIFEGMVLARKHGTEPGATFTVRKVASGVGVEKIYPLYSPMIDHIEVVKRAKVRRAKLYHVRRKAAKDVSREMRNLRTERPGVVEETIVAPEAPVVETAAEEKVATE